MNDRPGEENLSRQQLKSRHTKEKIFQAAKQILQTEGYEALSIKNICEKAGVSNGSFYHHFQTKDDLLSYYIEDQPSINPDLLAVPADLKEVRETIISVYLNYVAYCRDLGVTFIANYYTPKNQALNPETRTKRPYPITTVRSYLEKAMEAGVLPQHLNLEEITTDIRMLVIGNVFEWSMRNGEPDFEGNVRRSIGTYLDGVLGSIKDNEQIRI